MKGDWEADKAVARAILGNRALRRRALAIGLIITLSLLVLGLWVIDGWLGQSMLLFVLWWGICALVTLWVLLFALLDALISIQEVKGTRHK